MHYNGTQIINSLRANRHAPFLHSRFVSTIFSPLKVGVTLVFLVRVACRFGAPDSALPTAIRIRFCVLPCACSWSVILQSSSSIRGKSGLNLTALYRLPKAQSTLMAIVKALRAPCVMNGFRLWLVCRFSGLEAILLARENRLKTTTFNADIPIARFRHHRNSPKVPYFTNQI
jgi:hypothetical protein